MDTEIHPEDATNKGAQKFKALMKLPIIAVMSALFRILNVAFEFIVDGSDIS